ncbi:MAG: SAM-dependent methyltransferase [Glaciecola sp.]|jgi:tRNA G46 methylase TrmB
MQPYTGAGNSRTVETNQTGVHEDLLAIVEKYRHTQFKKPIQVHTQQAFNAVAEWLGGWTGPVILDSCCGVGESTTRIAQAYPDAKVIGVDKSDLRVGKHSHYEQSNNNSIVVRADVIDFWRLAQAAQWQLTQHYMLYPNPYPKKMQVQKRWHGHPVFASALDLGGELIQRSNWLLYLQEAKTVLEYYGYRAEITPVSDEEAFTPFERKYQASGQDCWELRANLHKNIAIQGF